MSWTYYFGVEIQVVYQDNYYTKILFINKFQTFILYTISRYNSTYLIIYFRLININLKYGVYKWNLNRL